MIATRSTPHIPVRVDPPEDIDTLMWRAYQLSGKSLGQIAASLCFELATTSSRKKGQVGELLEHALGVTKVPGATLDFPWLGIELKSIPVRANGHPIESTFVCSLPLHNVEQLVWPHSWVRTKLGCVLWLPIEISASGRQEDRIVHDPVLWSPTPEQDAILQADFDEIVGTLATRGVDHVTAHMGRWLQLRPKAANARIKTKIRTLEGQLVETVPRGFYLRTTFTSAILVDPTALP